MPEKMYRFGAAIGRYCPAHLGHQAVLAELDRLCHKSVVFIGSANGPQSLPLFFSFEERRQFLLAVRPDLNPLPLPDFPGNNSAWLTAIDAMLKSAGMDPHETVFFGGAREELLELSEEGQRKIHVVNRFDGTTTVTSGKAVRDALIEGRSLEGILDRRIIDLVQETWNKRWTEFKTKR